MLKTSSFKHLLLLTVVMCSPSAIAIVYHIGEGLEYTAIGDVPLESIKAGDSVMIHFRAEPYCEKWVIAI